MRWKAGHYEARETERERELHGAQLAGFGWRLLAFLIDMAVAVVVWIPLESGWREWVMHQQDIRIVWDFHEVGNVIVVVAYHGLIGWLTNGVTIGKWIAGIRIRSLVAERIGLWQSIERALGYGAALLEGGLGFVQYFWSENRMCAQDRLAETIVVDVRRGSRS